MRFLVDENLPIEVADLLRRHGHDAPHLSQTEHRGALDEEVWSLAAQEQRIVLTRDLGFSLPVSPRLAGVVPLRVPDVFTGQQLIRVVAEFVASPAFQQVAGAITVVSPGRVRVRAY